MDSGQPLRGFRNDEWRRVHARAINFPFHLSNSLCRHHPPPGLASGEPDDRLQRVIQYSRVLMFSR
jgi:hypothetical protein